MTQIISEVFTLPPWLISVILLCVTILGIIILFRAKKIKGIDFGSGNPKEAIDFLAEEVEPL